MSAPAITLADDVRACEQAVIEFLACFDAGDAAGMLRLFAGDGVWKRQDGDIHGVEELRVFMERWPADRLVRHVLSNMRTTLTPDGKAVVESYITVYRSDDPETPGPASFKGPDLVGRDRDVLIKAAGVWKIEFRQVTVDFKSS